MGARPDAIRAVDAIRPYRGGNDLLWQLSRLNNIDKHRLLLTVGSAYKAFNITPSIQSSWRETAPDWAKNITIPPIIIRPADRLFPLKAGDKLFAGAADAELDVKMQFAFEIAFGEPQIIQGEPLIKTVHEFANLVDSIIPVFEPLLA